MLFLRADLSQADSRYVYLKSGDPELIGLARKPPDLFDVHKFVGSIIFDCDESLIVGEKRKANKKIVHGTHYEEYPQRISDQLLKDGYYIPVEVCSVGQARYLKRFPAIKTGYQAGVRMRILKERRLVNSFGRTIFFPHERFDAPLYRRGYAWTAASEVADLLDLCGFVPLHEWIIEHNLSSRINAQVHDEVLTSTNIKESWDVARFLRDNLSKPRSYEGLELSMPVTFAIETRYHSEEIEFKSLPPDTVEGREQFMEGFMKVWEQRIR